MKFKILTTFLILVLFSNFCIAKESLRELFQNGHANICSINIRNFNAKDLNHDEIIDANEVSGNFLNAIDRLDEIKNLHINTLHLLPITPTGKLKALGTAGSLYAISDFSSINPQLIDLTSTIPAKEQAKLFIEECHKRGIFVIIDLPSCGAYDLFLDHPEYFVKNKKSVSIVPADWTDVRLFNTGKDDNLNEDLIQAHKNFIDMIISLGADGIRADVATIKPAKFWKELINYSREKNPNFMYLAEASDSWREPPSKFAVFTPYNKLLEVGFDGYYGSFFNLKNWKTSEEFFNHVKFNKKLLNSYPEAKNVILSFTTHDEISPVVQRNERFSIMICWLEATLPFNPYFVDGFQSGDKYLYQWANSKAKHSETDDDSYFVHHGKLDIFNFSRKPEGNIEIIKYNFQKAFDFRAQNIDLVTKGLFTQLKCNNDKIIAYSRFYKDNLVIVLANLDFDNSQKNVCIKLNGIKKNSLFENVTGSSYNKIRKNKIISDFSAGEIKVLKIDKNLL